MTAPDPVHAAVHALSLEVLAQAGRCLAVSAWPAPSPPGGTPDVPVVEVQQDGDDVPAVFSFATVVADDGPCQAPLEIRRGDVGDDSVAVGDEVGLELPLPQVAALALALVDAVMAWRDDDAFRPLPHELAERLRESGRLDAVRFSLAALADRFAAPTTPALARLAALADLGGPRCRAARRISGGDDGSPPALLLLIVDDGTARVLVLPATHRRQTLRQLVSALPPPPPSSPLALWHRLADVACWGGPVAAGPFVATVKAVTVDGADVVVTLHLALREGEGDEARVVDEREARCTLQAPPWLLQQDVDDDGAARAAASATRFLRRSLEAAASLRLAPERILHGSAWALVVARAGFGLGLEPRGNTGLDVSDMDDEGRVTIDVGSAVEGARVVLSPADDALLVPVPANRSSLPHTAAHTVPPTSSQLPSDAGETVLRVAYQRGQTLDGDDEAARAVCLALAHALDGGEADLELVLVDDDGSERETRLSTWLRGLADLPAAGRLPPHASARDAFADVADALLG
jgi:hypothetical protein